MCGINGFSFSDKKLLAAMNAAIAYRGPDDQGMYTDKLLTFGQLRLSIIDLTPAGHQPMWYTKNKRTVGIVFNGEIYNFQEIKQELVSMGYAFVSSSDTEVILASYLAWGPDCVKRFNGMWAFCLYDKEKQLLFCSRDRAGKKPFYYYADGKQFIFSSELKGILAHKHLNLARADNINSDAVGFYFSLGFIPAPFTIYKNVSKLEARQSLLYDLKKQKITKKWTYYELPAYKPIKDKKLLIKQGKELLKDAVRLRMIADVPVGAFLSGGLDSSTVVGEMANFTKLENLHTFSIGFQGKFDETPHINIVKDAFKTKHHHYYFTEKDFHELLPKFSDIYDEPFWDYSGFPTYKVSELARKHVTVSLSGDGGDEIFGGYMTHVTGYRMDVLHRFPRILRLLGSKIPAKKDLGGFTNFYLLTQGLKLSLEAPDEFYAKALEHEGIKPRVYKEWTKQKLQHCLKLSGGNMAEAMRLFDLLYHTIPDLFLVKVDRASMQNALEVRAPFLDYRLMEYAQTIPASWKVDSFKTKKLMREIIKDTVPEAIVNRGKQGFTPPLEEWILQPTYEKELLSSLAILATVDPELHTFYKTKVFAESNKLYTNYKIRLFLFGRWWRRWIDSKPSGKPAKKK